MPITTYGNPKIYSLHGVETSSGLSAQLYGSEKRQIMYMSEPYGSPSYDLNYFLDSPSEELDHPSSSGFSQTHFELQPVSAYLTEMGPTSTAQNPFDSSYVPTRDRGDLSPETVEFDEDKMKLKLQELEHALLDDDVDDQSMEFDEEWASPTRNTMTHDSPKETSSSGSSNLSSISSNKEVSVPSSRTPKQLLFDCAAMISKGNWDEAAAMINMLRQMVSIHGEPSERIAAYMVEGLAARLADSGKCLYKALRCKEPPSFDRLAAMQILFEVCPCFKFGFMAANGAITEAFENEKKVHIIDFDINQGTQYMNLIQSLAKRTGPKLPYIRLTGVDDPDSVQRPIGGLRNIGQRLELFAKSLSVPFTFQAVPSSTSLVTPEMLHCKAGEALIVNFAFQLHHMPDESVSTINMRDRLLRMVKGLNPKLVTVVEQDVNTNTAPFLSRFAGAYTYYSAVFKSLDATLPRESQDRVNVEKQCLARDIVNIIACEGEERIERYEVAGKWRARMAMAGFRSWPMSERISDRIQELIKEYCDKYKVKEEMGALHFGWEDKNLIVASAWR